MSEHTGFHNKEHYSPDCPKCYGTGEKEHKRTIKTPPKPRPKSMKLDSPREKIARKLYSRFEERKTIVPIIWENARENTRLYFYQVADGIIALIEPLIEEAKQVAFNKGVKRGTTIRNINWNSENHQRHGKKMVQAREDAKKQERKEHWIDAPDKRGDHWLSPFIKGKGYISPRLISVIDYDRPDRGLEVQYDFANDTIPVDIFCKEYYPKAKWLFIPEPNWQALGKK